MVDVSFPCCMCLLMPDRQLNRIPDLARGQADVAGVRRCTSGDWGYCVQYTGSIITRIRMVYATEWRWEVKPSSTF